MVFYRAALPQNRPTVTSDGGGKYYGTVPANAALAAAQTVIAGVPDGTKTDVSPYENPGVDGGNPGNGKNGTDVILVGGNGNKHWSSPSGSTTAPVTPTAPVNPEPTIEDRYKAMMEAANERLKQAYDFQQAQLKKAQGDAFREAFIKQQMVQRAYPEQLAAAGINGGAAQGVLARNNADYAKQRTSIWNNFLDGVNQAGQNFQQGVFANNENFLANMAAYHQAQEQMKQQHEYDMQLAKLRASLG